MVKTAAPRHRIGPAILGITCIAIAAATAWSLAAGQSDGMGSAKAAAEITGSTTPADKLVGRSGLPLPRFVSLKADKINVRRGPSSEHQVAWVYQRKGLPVEITAEFDTWRKIRDSEGSEGWVLHSLLSGRRTVLVAPWKKGAEWPLLARPAEGADTVAKLQSGVIANVKRCERGWCRIYGTGYDGYMLQKQLWGVYPDERVE